MRPCLVPWPVQHPEGGFGGGPYQLAHLAPTYAAVAALVTLGGEDALSGGPLLRHAGTIMYCQFGSRAYRLSAAGTWVQ